MQAVNKNQMREKIVSEKNILIHNNDRAGRNLSKLFSKIKTVLFSDIEIITVKSQRINPLDVNSYNSESKTITKGVKESPLTASYRSQVFFR